MCKICSLYLIFPATEGRLFSPPAHKGVSVPSRPWYQITVYLSVCVVVRITCCHLHVFSWHYRTNQRRRSHVVVPSVLSDPIGIEQVQARHSTPGSLHASRVTSCDPISTPRSIDKRTLTPLEHTNHLPKESKIFMCNICRINKKAQIFKLVL